MIQNIVQKLKMYYLIITFEKIRKKKQNFQKIKKKATNRKYMI